MEAIPENEELKPFVNMLQNNTDPVSKDRDMQKDISILRAGSDYHSSMVLSHWDKLTSIIDTIDTAIDLDGKSLDLATVIAIARHVIDIETQEN